MKLDDTRFLDYTLKVGIGATLAALAVKFMAHYGHLIPKYLDY